MFPGVLEDSFTIICTTAYICPREDVLCILAACTHGLCCKGCLARYRDGSRIKSALVTVADEWEREPPSFFKLGYTYPCVRVLHEFCYICMVKPDEGQSAKRVASLHACKDKN